MIVLNDPQFELNNIVWRLKSFKPPPQVDLEQLAVDIWVQYHHEHGQAPTWVELKSRLIDAIRKAKVRRTQQIPFDLPETKHEPIQTVEFKTTINELMRSTTLKPEEKIIIHDLYYAGRSVADSSKLRTWPQTRVRDLHYSALSKLKRAAQRVSPESNGTSVH